MSSHLLLATPHWSLSPFLDDHFILSSQTSHIPFLPPRWPCFILYSENRSCPMVPPSSFCGQIYPLPASVPAPRISLPAWQGKCPSCYCLHSGCSISVPLQLPRVCQSPGESVQCRVWSTRSGPGPETLHFLQAPTSYQWCQCFE